MSVAFFIFAAAAAGEAQPVSKPNPERLAVKVMQEFGTCVARQDSRRARELLASDYREPDYQQAMAKLADRGSGCLRPGGRLMFSPMLFAGAMAEALLEKDFKRSELPRRLAYDASRETIEARSSTEAMALCTVLNAPQAAAQLLETEPSTPEESKAMQPLGPVLMDCLKKDMKLELNKPALRSVLALAAYRIVWTPRKAVTQ